MLNIIANGETFAVDENTGYISRPAMPGFQPSGQWKMVGVTVRTTGANFTFLPLHFFIKRLGASASLCFKNGKPRYYVRDLDHGASRQWGAGITQAWIS